MSEGQTPRRQRESLRRRRRPYISPRGEQPSRRPQTQTASSASFTRSKHSSTRWVRRRHGHPAPRQGRQGRPGGGERRPPVGDGGAPRAVGHGGADHGAQLRGVPARHGVRALPRAAGPAGPRRRRARHRAHQHHGPQRALRPRLGARAALRAGLRLPQPRPPHPLPPARHAPPLPRRAPHRAAVAQRGAHPRRAGPGPRHLRPRRRLRALRAPGPRRQRRAPAAPGVPPLPGDHQAHGGLLRDRRRAPRPAQRPPRLRPRLRRPRRRGGAGAHQHQHAALPARIHPVGARVRRHVEGLGALHGRRQRPARAREARRAQLRRRLPRVVVVRGRHRARRVPAQPGRRRRRRRGAHPDHQPHVHRAHGARGLRLHQGWQRAGRRQAPPRADGGDGGAGVRAGDRRGARGVDGGAEPAVGGAVHDGAGGGAPGGGGDAHRGAVRAGQLPADHGLRRAPRHGAPRRRRTHQPPLLLPRRHPRRRVPGVRRQGRVQRPLVRPPLGAGHVRRAHPRRRRLAHRLAGRGHARQEARRPGAHVDDGHRRVGEQAPRRRQRRAGGGRLED